MAEPTVILADDDGGIRTVISRALSRQGYRVQATATAATLWRWIEDGTGDVAIIDVVLPDENTLDLLPRIKQRRPRPADHRDERAEHAADRGPGDRARRLRLSAQAVRPRPSGDPGQARARAAARGAASSPRIRAASRSSCRSSAARRRCRRSTASSRG